MNKQINCEKESLLYQIAAWDFRKTDLALFLDTHPHDMQAIMLFEEAKYQSNILRTMYENNYGPLVQGTTCPNHWDWVNDPWPWEAK